MSSQEPDRYWLNPVIPVDRVALASLVVVVAAGVYIGAHIPTQPPITVVAVLLAIAGALLLASCVSLLYIKSFAWKPFFLVLRWVVVEYLVEAGMLEYVFTYDHVRGTMLVILTIGLFIFASDIPIIMAFTVARYQKPV